MPFRLPRRRRTVKKAGNDLRIQATTSLKARAVNAPTTITIDATFTKAWKRSNWATDERGGMQNLSTASKRKAVRSAPKSRA